MRLSVVHKPFVTPHIFTTSDLAILKTAMCFKGNFCVKSSNSVPVVYMYAKFLCFVSEVGFLMKSVNFLPSSKNCFNQFCNLYLYYLLKLWTKRCKTLQNGHLQEIEASKN